MGERINDIEFEKCLNSGKIRPFARGKLLSHKELETAKTDLEDAKISLNAGRFKWSTIQAYYSMFHSARALLYFKGYRERSHFCLVVGIRALYISQRLLDNKLVESLQLGKKLRENADYYNEFSKDGANALIRSADEFLKTAKNIIEKL